VTRKGSWLAPLLAVLALGFARRVYDLDGQSMWSDEGLSLYRAPVGDEGTTLLGQLHHMR
jgi:hypothetical protein